MFFQFQTNSASKYSPLSNFVKPILDGLQQSNFFKATNIIFKPNQKLKIKNEQQM